MNVNKVVKVWDPLIRIFHWSLAALFTIAYLSGEDESILHPWSGYLIIGLLVFRLVWGFIGPQHARFSDFIFSVKEIKAYAKGLISGNAKRHLGHNPLGGLMVFTLLFSLSITTVTGLMVYGAEEGKGPLASVMAGVDQKAISLPSVISSAHADDDHEHKHNGKHGESEILEEVHEFFANFTLLLVLIHLIGVFVESVFHRESLVTAMVTGEKRKFSRRF